MDKLLKTVVLNYSNVGRNDSLRIIFSMRRAWKLYGVHQVNTTGMKIELTFTWYKNNIQYEDWGGSRSSSHTHHLLKSSLFHLRTSFIKDLIILKQQKQIVGVPFIWSMIIIKRMILMATDDQLFISLILVQTSA